MHHQRYLESIEAAERAENLRLTGVTEDILIDHDTEAQEDIAKTKHIFSKIGANNVEIADVSCPAREVVGNRPSAINIKLQDTTTRR